MKKTLLFILVLFSLNTFGQTNLTTIRDIISKYQNETKIHYKIDLKFKYFDKDYFDEEIGEVRILKKDSDTIFGAKFLYDYRFKRDTVPVFITKYYDGNDIYVIDHIVKEITKINPIKDGIWTISNRLDGLLLETYFIDPDDLNIFTTSERFEASYKDSVNYLKAEFKYPQHKEADVSDRIKSIYFNKRDLTIDKIIFQAKWKDQIQINEWELTEIQFDSFAEEDLKKLTKPYFDNYTLEEFEPIPDSYYDLMPIGEFAPNIKGHYFPNYFQETELSARKITLLDFWYTSCFPCAKAIPELNKLQTKYGDAIDIIGVNDKEYKPEQKEKIDSFLKRIPMEYKIFLTKEVPEEYNVNAYPTLYILDAQQKVLYTKSGYSEEMFEELSEIIDYFLEN